MGSLDGVLSTRSVWVGAREVVHLTYDSEVIQYSKLLENAARMECTDAIYTHGDDQAARARKTGVFEIVDWKDSLETRQVRKPEQKYYLRNTVYAHLPLSELQAVKMNVAAARKDIAALESFLSPRQR